MLIKREEQTKRQEQTMKLWDNHAYKQKEKQNRRE